MPPKVLLDTDIILALFARDLNVRKQLLATPEVFIPGIVFGELYLGAYSTPDPESNLMRISNFGSVCSILPCDMNTALAYSQVKNALRSKGRLVPENDIWIAALSLQHGLPLVTRDDHFKAVEGLQVESW
jgi:tRNA(fMet)-specific endonuclease VapC